jgi:hypothetical protein
MDLELPLSVFAPSKLKFSANEFVQPLIAIQSLISAEEQSIAMAILIFCQNFGGAVFLIIAETIFGNSLRRLIAEYVPGADVKAVIAAGATGWRSILSENQVSGV